MRLPLHTMRHGMLPSRALALALPVLVLAACGGDSSDPSGEGSVVPPPSEVLTVQERVDLADFSALGDPDLAAIAAGLTLHAAGHVEDSAGRTVDWAEGTRTDGSVATAVRHCGDEGCVVAEQTASRDELTWKGLDGKLLDPRPVGVPPLFKNLVSHDMADKTTLQAALAGADATLGLTVDEEALPAADFAQRRFLALNTFGPALGVDLAPLLDAAQASGRFDGWEELRYAREDDVVSALRDLDLGDALVWVTQAVRDEAMSGGRAWRTVGLTVNQGGYGDATMDRDALTEAWEANLLSGPGLLFLAASNSYSDGSDLQPDNGSVWRRLEGSFRLLVGIEGDAPAPAIIESARAFLAAWYGDGASLADALAAGDVPLAPTGAKLHANTQVLDARAPASDADLWTEVPWQPSSIRLTVHITAIPYCRTGDGPMQPGKEDFATAFADITFDGASFQGHRASSDTTLRGFVTGLEVGDRLAVEFFGNLNKAQFQDIHGFGEGLIQQVITDDQGRLVVSFDGPAHTSEYTNDQGQTCVLKDPQMTSTTSELSTLVLTP